MAATLVGESEKIREVVLVEAEPPEDVHPGAAARIAADIAARVAGRSVTLRRPADPTSFGDLGSGQLCVAPTNSGRPLATSDPPHGAAVLLVLEPMARSRSEDDRSLVPLRDAPI